MAELDRSTGLDTALARVLAPPTLPEGFHARLRAEIARDADRVPRQQRRSALEREWQAVSRQLDATRRRLGLATVGLLSGAVVVPAVALAVMLPWIRATFGADGVAALPLAGTAVGLAIAAAAGAAALRPGR